jgi:hypothetical protein
MVEYLERDRGAGGRDLWRRAEVLFGDSTDSMD